MDIYCQQCGEPWDIKKFNRIGGIKGNYLGTRSTTVFLDGRGCPKCQWGQTRPKERPKRAEMTQVLMEELRGDLDVIAIELESMDKMGLLNENI